MSSVGRIGLAAFAGLLGAMIIISAFGMEIFTGSHDDLEAREMNYIGFNDLIEIDGVNFTVTWEEMSENSTEYPEEHSRHGWAFDSEEGVFIHFEGHSGGKTWTYDLETNTWKDMKPTTSPSVERANAGMAYDPVNEKTVLFGDWRGGSATDDTWAYDYDTNNWTEMNPTTSPRKRNNMGFVFVEDRACFIMYGGQDYSSFLSDTWFYWYGNNTWWNPTTTGTPGNRAGHSMAYHESLDRIVMIGGGVNGDSNDTWMFDIDNLTWSRQYPFTAPSERSKHSMSYDPNSELVLLFGGGVGSTQYNDLWGFDGIDWHQLTTAVKPATRSNTEMGYDTAQEKLVLFGGEDPNSDYQKDDVWVLTIEKEEWLRIDTDADQYYPGNLVNTTIESNVDANVTIEVADPDDASFIIEKVVGDVFTFTIPKGSELGNYTIYATIDGGNVTANCTFELLKYVPPEFEFLEIVFPSSVSLGDTFTVSVKVSNPFDEEKEVYLTLQVHGPGRMPVPVEVELVDIDAESTLEQDLSVEIPDDYDAGSWTFQVNLMEELPRNGGHSLVSYDGMFTVN